MPAKGIAVANTFGRSAKHMMKATRLTQEDVAEKVGVSQGMVSRWLRGENIPDVYQAKMLAESIGLPLDMLLDGRAEMLGDADVRELRMLYDLVAKIGVGESISRLLAVGSAETRGEMVPVRIEESIPGPVPKKRRLSS